MSVPGFDTTKYMKVTDHLAALEAERKGWREQHERDVAENNKICQTLDRIREEKETLETAVDDEQQEVESLTYEPCEKGRAIDELREKIITLEAAVKEKEEKIIALTEELRLSKLRGESLDRVIAESTEECVALKKEIRRLSDLYHDLIMQVAKKYPGESRHDTAKRYILDRERHGIGTNQTALQGKEKKDAKS
jgi:chromosome segregation ATPase